VALVHYANVFGPQQAHQPGASTKNAAAGLWAAILVILGEQLGIMSLAGWRRFRA
jgi:branched-subunit amino acid transport protein